MADVQYWDDQLANEIDAIRSLLDRIPNASEVEKKDKFDEAEKKMRAANGTKRSFKMECRLVADPNERRTFENKLSRHEEELAQLQSDLKALQSERERGMLFDGANAEGLEMSPEAGGDALVNQMHDIQNKTGDSLERTKALVAESKDIGMATVEELVRQRQQIEDITEETMKIEDNLKRSEKLIKTFGRRMATDKFIMGCACLNVSFLVGIIAYKVFQGDDKSATGGKGQAHAPPDPMAGGAGGALGGRFLDGILGPDVDDQTDGDKIEFDAFFVMLFACLNTVLTVYYTIMKHKRSNRAVHKEGTPSIPPIMSRELLAGDLDDNADKC